MVRKKTETVKNGVEILVNTSPVEKRVAILEDGRLMDFLMEREGLEHYVGNIYKGRVNAIVPGIEAAFVEIGLEKNAFLHVSDVANESAALKGLLPEGEPQSHKAPKPKGTPKIEKILKVGQEMMVQVVKEAIGTKGPRVTTYVSLPGRYVVLTPGEAHIGISRRIKDRDERKRIRDIMNDAKLPEGMGCIVRTMAENLTEKEMREEMSYLANLWNRIKARLDRNPAPVLVYEEYGAVLTMVRDKFTEDVAHLTVDSKEEYLRIIKFLQAFRPALRKKVRLYTDRLPLFQKYDLERRIDEIFERKVSLKSGGNLVIEQTEGLIAIDVNTGKFTGKKNLEETVYKTNLEAAREIPRQLMLRDIGGIVIIDFIDMEDRVHRESVFNVLQQELARDKARMNLRSISQFGIVEMTRQRMRKSLESTSHTECPYCGGKGVIKSAETIAIETARKIDKVLAGIKSGRKSVKVMTHPDIHVALMSDQAKMLRDIQRKFRCKIDLRDDLSMHREEVTVEEGN